MNNQRQELIQRREFPNYVCHVFAHRAPSLCPDFVQVYRDFGNGEFRKEFKRYNLEGDGLQNRAPEMIHHLQRLSSEDRHEEGCLVNFRFAHLIPSQYPYTAPFVHIRLLRNTSSVSDKSKFYVQGGNLNGKRDDLTQVLRSFEGLVTGLQVDYLAIKMKTSPGQLYRFPWDHLFDIEAEK